MRPDVDGQAMNLPLHREVLELAEVLGSSSLRTEIAPLPHAT